jgi:pimeloyl-ACP methyl ester carboxylesterase
VTAAAPRFVALPSPTGRRNPAGFHPCQGLYWTPAGAQPRIALIASHYSVDFSEHYLGEAMAARGFGFLGWNTRYRGAEHYFQLARALDDIGAGIAWLREQGIETVALLGNSGGGSLMAAYQGEAAARQLPPGDLYISLQAHLGRPEVLTSWMDPSVTDESDPVSLDPALDMYNPANGPPYPADFVDRYRAAQIERNHRITRWARAELERLAAGRGSDRVFSVPRVWADLRLLDGSLDPSDRDVGRCYLGDPRRANYSPHGIAAATTLRSWLEMWSLAESPCRAAPHLARIEVPSLVVQSTADTGVFPSDAHAIHDGLAATDKRLELIAGDHYLRRPEGARDAAADLITEWLRSRV